MVFENVAGNDDIFSISLLQDNVLRIDDTIQNDSGKKTIRKIFLL
jgi:hypothetical protein